MRCVECGTINDDGARFCTNCGSNLVTEPTNASRLHTKPSKLPIILVFTSIGILVIALVIVLSLLRPWEASVKNNRESHELEGASQTGLLKTSHVVISFNGNSATGGDTAPISCTKGDEVILPKCGFVREGYEFARWIDDAGSEYEPGDTLTATKNMTLVAAWIPSSVEQPQNAVNDTSSLSMNPAPTEASSTPSPAASFPRKWSGTYLGTSSYADGDGHHISRAVALHFTSVDETGYLEGICYVGTDEAGPGETYGTYYISGNVDWSSGVIHFQGTRWIDQGGLGELREYSGYANLASQSMEGSAWDVGTRDYETPWSMHAVNEITIWQNGNLITV